jgi:hypothetical protein
MKYPKIWGAYGAGSAVGESQIKILAELGEGTVTSKAVPGATAYVNGELRKVIVDPAAPRVIPLWWLPPPDSEQRSQTDHKGVFSEVPRGSRGVPRTWRSVVHDEYGYVPDVAGSTGVHLGGNRVAVLVCDEDAFPVSNTAKFGVALLPVRGRTQVEFRSEMAVDPIVFILATGYDVDAATWRWGYVRQAWPVYSFATGYIPTSSDEEIWNSLLPYGGENLYGSGGGDSASTADASNSAVCITDTLPRFYAGWTNSDVTMEVALPASAGANPDYSLWCLDTAGPGKLLGVMHANIPPVVLGSGASDWLGYAPDVYLVKSDDFGASWQREDIPWLSSLWAPGPSAGLPSEGAPFLARLVMTYVGADVSLCEYQVLYYTGTFPDVTTVVRSYIRRYSNGVWSAPIVGTDMVGVGERVVTLVAVQRQFDSTEIRATMPISFGHPVVPLETYTRHHDDPQFRSCAGSRALNAAGIGSIFEITSSGSPTVARFTEDYGKTWYGVTWSGVAYAQKLVHVRPNIGAGVLGPDSPGVRGLTVSVSAIGSDRDATILFATRSAGYAGMHTWGKLPIGGKYGGPLDPPPTTTGDTTKFVPVLIDPIVYPMFLNEYAPPPKEPA